MLYGSPFLDDETERLFKEYDRDRDGKIEFEEFSQIIIGNAKRLQKTNK